MNPLNVLETYVFAENYGDQHLVYQCLRLIDRHASHILSSSSFPSLPAAGRAGPPSKVCDTVSGMWRPHC